MKRSGSVKQARKQKSTPLIALLTDFGTSDHYVGTMKGVILSINPQVRIVDISHDVNPHDVRQGGYLLWASYRFFPSKTVFVAVVDPGVGGRRRIVCMESGDRVFIAPDNGLLDFVVLQENIREAYEILQSEPMTTNTISSTFHGRDIFGPLAANLTVGRSIGKFGKPFSVKTPSSPFYSPEAGADAARVLHIDRFGNLITNIPERYFEGCTIGVGTTRISRRIRTYAEAPSHEVCLIIGSSGLIEIVAKESSAADLLRAGLNTPITVLKGVGSR